MNGRAWRQSASAVRALGRLLCASLGMLVLISPAGAGDFSIIAQSGQAAPDGNGTLTTFTMPARDRGVGAFAEPLIDSQPR